MFKKEICFLSEEYRENEKKENVVFSDAFSAE